MKRLILIIAIFLSSCGSASNTPDGYNSYKFNHIYIKGIECISWKEGYAGGLTCNWDKHNKESK